jgi:hypothetical protein
MVAQTDSRLRGLPWGPDSTVVALESFAAAAFDPQVDL